MRAQLVWILPAGLVLVSCGGATAQSPVGGHAPTLDPSANAAENVHARMEAFRHLSDTGDSAEAAEARVVWRVPVGGAPQRGNPLAPVTIVEFGDFQCGFCLRAERTLSQIRATYGPLVRVVWRDVPLPFHDRAVAAAELAREARREKGDAGFWAAHDALMLQRGPLDDAALELIAGHIGVDPRQVAAAVAQDRYQDGLDDDIELADDVGAEGTPTFFVNGRRIVGAQPFESFKPIIDEELVRTAASVQNGVPIASPYEQIIQSGQLAPDPRKVDVPIPATAAMKGDPAATIVIQEFADFQCPYCARAEETVRRVMARYPTQVKLVWRHLPLPMHAYAELAAEAAAEAKKQKGNAGFWAMHDKLLANLATPHGLERPALGAYAREIGLDSAAFEKSLDARSHAAEVTIDAKAADAADIHGTPAFLVAGYELDGAQPFVRFRKVIRKALGEPSR